MTRKRILVVEDNDDVRNVVTTYLSAKNFEVIEASNGQEGLDKALSIAPDLVLFDILLPLLDGIAALKALRAAPQGKTVPVVMMSAVLQSRDIQAETASLRVSAIMQKPFQVRVLLQTIETALAGGMAGVERRDESVIEMAPTTDTAPAHRRRRQITVRSTLPVELAHGASFRPPDQGGATGTSIEYTVPDFNPRSTLEQLSVPEILNLLFLENATGRLRLVHRSVEKRIYFQNGFPVYAESSLPEETLGAYLVGRGKLTLDQHKATVAEMEASGRQYGATLLNKGVLGPHELYKELEAHLKVKILATFGWFTGHYLFEYGDDWKEDIVPARMNVGQILFEGIYTHWRMDEMSKIVSIEGSHIPVVLDSCGYGETELGLSSVESRVLQLVQGEGDVSSVVERIGDRRRAFSSLFTLFLLGKIRFHAGRAKRLKENAEPRRNVEETEKRFMTEYLKYRTADYFTLLGVSQDASDKEISDAFIRLKKRYHPDSLTGVSGLVHEKIEELNLKAHKAYQVLHVPADKQQYIRSLHASGEKNTMLTPRSRTSRQQPISSGQTVDHSFLFEKGFSLLRDGRYPEAEECFVEVHQTHPSPKNTAHLLWARVLIGTATAEDALVELKVLAGAHKDEPSVPYLMGVVSLRLKRGDDALRCFEKALRIDPDHIDSNRQLRLLRMRKSEHSGFFDVLKRKK